ncbi:MAG: hypothetical protein DDG60_08710 [Anaerolineae bacterium]|nr:MAG: hypothetical protein DDG60_08710 [Anaerolineae bacterium]
MRWLSRVSDYLTLFLFLFACLSRSDVRITQTAERVHILASEYAFDLTGWTAASAWLKLTQSAIASPRYFSPPSQREIVLQYFDLIEELQRVEREARLIFSDPNQTDREAAWATLRVELEQILERNRRLAPLSEAVLEMQVTHILHELGLTTGGQPIPWVLYHITPLPKNLVLSPREVIRQETSYLLQPEMTLEDIVQLEDTVSARLGYSTLVVEIGGLAAYPTMIMQTTALDWLSNTIAHEWIHLYLAQKPLGMNYDRTPQLRTMNETAASIAGDEIGRLVMERYYPERAWRYRQATQLAALQPLPTSNFDFRAEMYETRVRADELLAQGKIEEAEAYMEARRQFFWQNGYAIRKLNQAYFAFHGAYADAPGGAAGEDPVGPAVRALRARSATLKEFLERIGQMSSFEELLTAIEK